MNKVTFAGNFCMTLFFRRICSIFLICAASIGGTSVAAGELTHHDIVAKFDPQSRRLDVTDHISLSGKSEITFRLADWQKIVKAAVGDKILTPQRQSDIWKISLPNRTAKHLTLVLAGTPPPLPPKNRRRRGVGGAVAGLAGSYLPGYAAWIADTGDDWVNFKLRVEITGDQRAIATGRLLDEMQQGDTYRARFEADYPSELPSLFIGPYKIHEQKFDKTRLRAYFHPDIAPFAEGYLATAKDYIEGYSKLIGAYPFNDFHIISSPLPVGLGFPNLTYIGRMIVHLPFMRGRSLAHEVLHNWWGNGVVADYSRGNWSEGLTTYMADYALAAKRGPSSAREMRLGWLRDYAALPVGRDQPVIAFTSKTHQASEVIGYNKVASIFHMLRGELGADIFTQGLRNFWAKYKFQVAGWDAIQAEFEQAANRNLNWFFKQWLSRQGAPKIRVTDRPVLKNGSVAVTLRQDDPVYRLSVNVDVATTEGRKRHQVRLEGRSKSVELPLSGKLMSVGIDSDFDLFRRLLPGESPPILRDVTLAKQVTTFVLSSEPEFQVAAKVLIGRLLREAKVTSPKALNNPLTGPALVIGSANQISDFLASSQISAAPEEVKAGTAAAWVIRTVQGHPVLLVRADTSQSIKNITRPLPHYGRQSYLSFEGRKASVKGIWPTQSSPLSFRFDSGN